MNLRYPRSPSFPAQPGISPRLIRNGFLAPGTLSGITRLEHAVPKNVGAPTFPICRCSAEAAA